MPPILTKICCIASIEEAELAVRLGASALGLVSAMPSGPGVIAETRIAEIAAAIPPGIASFLLTSLTEPAAIIAQHHRCRTTTVQICDALPRGAHATLRQGLPEVTLVQVVHVTGEHSVAEALEIAPEVNALLLDSGNPSLRVRELGGTGRRHDWALSARIVRESPVPVWLAGGINATNVAEAIRTVRPFGIDLCSGVRSAGSLDETKVSHLMEAIAAAAY